MASVIGRGYNGGVSNSGSSDYMGSGQVHVTPPDKNGVSHTIVPNIVSNSGANVMAANLGNLVGSNEFFNSLYQDVMGISERHSAESQARAERQMQYQTMSDRTAMAWSAEEAKRNRDWQEQMSNTAHQREVDDLIRAGLNPILSSGGQGATTPAGSAGSGYSSNGAAGQVDMTNPANIMQSYFGDLLNSANIMAQLQTEKEIVAQNNATTRFASMNSLQGALASAGAVMGSAQLASDTQKHEGKLNREFNALNNFINFSKDFAVQLLHNQGQMDVTKEQHYNNPYGWFRNASSYVAGMADVVSQRVAEDKSSDANNWYHTYK